MASTFEPLATTTLGSAASSITFSSIPSTYTDLRLVLTCTASNGMSYILFNSSTSGYSWNLIYGNGTSADVDLYTSYSYLGLNSRDANNSNIAFYTVDIFSYAGSTYKTSLITSSHDQNGSGQVCAEVGLWQNTSAINQIDIKLQSTYTYSAGTTATLYGIKAA